MCVILQPCHLLFSQLPQAPGTVAPPASSPPPPSSPRGAACWCRGNCGNTDCNAASCKYYRAKRQSAKRSAVSPAEASEPTPGPTKRRILGPQVSRPIPAESSVERAVAQSPSGDTVDVVFCNRPAKSGCDLCARCSCERESCDNPRHKLDGRWCIAHARDVKTRAAAADQGYGNLHGWWKREKWGARLLAVARHAYWLDRMKPTDVTAYGDFCRQLGVCADGAEVVEAPLRPILLYYSVPRSSLLTLFFATPMYHSIILPRST